MLRMVELLPGEFINVDAIESIVFKEYPAEKKFLGATTVTVNFDNPKSRIKMTLSNTKDALAGEAARQWRDVSKAFGILRTIVQNATRENLN